MDPMSGQYKRTEELALLSDEERERFSVAVEGTVEDVEKLSKTVKDRALYEGAMQKLRYVRATGKEMARSGNPAIRAAGEKILGELE